ncbi:MAG: phage tail assembly protein [Synergistaceae bacterium]|jgi:hypothetical protein|nr:phage tail assembly protein [Synergistaceae bacterium]
MYVKFKEPFRFEDTDHEGVDLDLDGLTGDVLEKAQEIIFASGKPVRGMAELSKAYCSQVAAFASKKPVELIRALPAGDYNTIIVRVQDFLLDGVLEAQKTQ